MTLSGKYELVQNEGYFEHLLEVGVPEDLARKSLDQKSLGISISGDQVTIDRGSTDRPPQTYTLNQATDEKFPDGVTFKSTSTLKGDVLTIDSSDADGQSFIREYSLVGSELTLQGVLEFDPPCPGTLLTASILSAFADSIERLDEEFSVATKAKSGSTNWCRLRDRGVPEEFVKKAEDHEKKLEISVNGDKVTIKRPGDRRPEQTLILNQEVEEKFGENRTVKIKAVLNGDVLTVEAQGSHSFKKVYSVSGSELTVTLSSLKTGVPDAKRVYKRD